MPINHHHVLYAGLDIGALIVALGAFWSFLPGIAVLFAIGWYVVMLLESATVQRWLGRNNKIEVCPMCHRQIYTQKNPKGEPPPMG